MVLRTAGFAGSKSRVSSCESSCCGWYSTYIGLVHSVCSGHVSLLAGNKKRWDFIGEQHTYFGTNFITETIILRCASTELELLIGISKCATGFGMLTCWLNSHGERSHVSLSIGALIIKVGIMCFGLKSSLELNFCVC